MGMRKIRARTTQDGKTKRSEEHTSELQSQSNLVCRLLLEKKKIIPAIALKVRTLTSRLYQHRPIPSHDTNDRSMLLTNYRVNSILARAFIAHRPTHSLVH